MPAVQDCGAVIMRQALSLGIWVVGVRRFNFAMLERSMPADVVGIMPSEAVGPVSRKRRKAQNIGRTQAVQRTTNLT
jgi:hypothetical protein